MGVRKGRGGEGKGGEGRGGGEGGEWRGGISCSYVAGLGNSTHSCWS